MWVAVRAGSLDNLTDLTTAAAKAAAMAEMSVELTAGAKADVWGSAQVDVSVAMLAVSSVGEKEPCEKNDFMIPQSKHEKHTWMVLGLVAAKGVWSVDELAEKWAAKWVDALAAPRVDALAEQKAAVMGHYGAEVRGATMVVETGGQKVVEKAALMDAEKVGTMVA